MRVDNHHNYSDFYLQHLNPEKEHLEKIYNGNAANFALVFCF